MSPVARPVGSRCLPPSALARTRIRARSDNDSLALRTVSGAARVTAAHVEEIQGQLSDRDRTLLAALAQVRLATGRQLERLVGPSSGASPASEARMTRRALARLVAWRVLARFDRAVGGIRGGSESIVYTLDVAGLRLLSHHSNVVRRPWRPSRPFLAHHVAVTEVYVRLGEAQSAGRLEVLAFQTEPACWRQWQSPAGKTVLKPDAFVVLGTGAYEDRYFLEVDRATEGTAALRRQLAAHTTYYASGQEQRETGVFPLVLWIVPDQRRQHALERLIQRLPANARPLFRVTTEPELLDLFTEETTP